MRVLLSIYGTCPGAPQVDVHERVRDREDVDEGVDVQPEPQLVFRRQKLRVLRQFHKLVLIILTFF